MALWPLGKGGPRSDTWGAIAATSAGTTLVGGASNVKPTGWTEIIASLPFTADAIEVVFRGSAANGKDSGALVDIAVGSASNERVIVADLSAGFVSSGTLMRYTLPLRIMAGTRVSARVQTATASDSIECVIAPVTAGGPHGRRAQTLGADLATSRGTLLTVPGATHTKSAWVSLGTTTAPVRWLTFGVTISSTSATASSALVDIGVGATGSEAVVIGDVPLGIAVSEAITVAPVTVPVNLPAGTQISARYQSSSVGSGARPTILAYGID